MGAMLKRGEFKGDDEKLRAALRFVAHRVGEPLDRLAYDIEAVKIDIERPAVAAPRSTSPTPTLSLTGFGDGPAPVKRRRGARSARAPTP